MTVADNREEHKLSSRLHPDARKALEHFGSQRAAPFPGQLTVDQRAAYLAQARAAIATDTVILAGRGPAVGRVEDVSLPALERSVRLYVPESTEPRPLLLYFHGGGWIRGDLQMEDAICRYLANDVGAVVLSVDYPLAPEHPFPAATHDCYLATVWASEHARELGADPTQLVVVGSSVGANLAASTVLRSRDLGGPNLSLQVLLYACLDPFMRGPSYAALGRGYVPTSDNLAFYWEQYLPSPSMRSHPYAAPLYADDLSRLAPALIVTAEFDPLRDDSEAYANRLRETGVPVRFRDYDGHIHCLALMPALGDEARRALAEIASDIREMLLGKG